MSNYSDYEIEGDYFTWHVDEELIHEEISDLRATITPNKNSHIIQELFEYIRCNSNYRIVSKADLVREADHDFWVQSYYAHRNFYITPKSNKEALDIKKAERAATRDTAHHVGLWGISSVEEIYIDDSFLDDHGDLRRIYRLWRLIDDPVHGNNMVARLKRDFKLVFKAYPIPEQWRATPHTIAYHTSTNSNHTTVEVAPRENPVDVAYYLEYDVYPAGKDKELPVVDECKPIYGDDDEYISDE